MEREREWEEGTYGALTKAEIDSSWSWMTVAVRKQAHIPSALWIYFTQMNTFFVYVCVCNNLQITLN